MASVGNISGGGGVYSYQWDALAGSQTTDTAFALAAGNYSIRIFDQDGCFKDTTVSVKEPDLLIVDTTFQDSVNCFGGFDGYAAVFGLGGNGIYSYSWDVNTGSQTSDTAIGLGAGLYNVTISDQNGCLVDTSVEVFEPLKISISSGSDSATCGNSDGLAYISATGGTITSDYFYSWKDNSGSRFR